MTKKCIICGRTFKTEVHNKTTCSKKCVKVHKRRYLQRRMENPEYSKYREDYDRVWRIKKRIRLGLFVAGEERARCSECGKSFFKNRVRQKTCSKKCSEARVRRRNYFNKFGSLGPRAKCLECGRSFKAVQWGPRLCSEVCRLRRKRRTSRLRYIAKRAKLCRVCGKPQKDWEFHRKVTCSPECSHINLRRGVLIQPHTIRRKQDREISLMLQIMSFNPNKKGQGQ